MTFCDLSEKLKHHSKMNISWILLLIMEYLKSDQAVHSFLSGKSNTNNGISNKLNSLVCFKNLFTLLFTSLTGTYGQ